MSAARRDAGGGRLQPGGDGRRGIVDFDHARRSASARARGPSADAAAAMSVRNSPSVSDAAERFGGDALDGGLAGFQRLHELRQRRAITPQAGGMNRGPPHALVTIAERDANRLARLRALDARQRPHGVAPRLRGA